MREAEYPGSSFAMPKHLRNKVITEKVVSVSRTKTTVIGIHIALFHSASESSVFPFEDL